MIEKFTGALLLADGVELEPSLTRRKFASSTLGATALPYVNNPPWESFMVPAVCRDGTTVHLTIFFRGGSLKTIHIRLADTGRTEDEQIEVLQRHDAWLRHSLGEPPFVYSWGSVEASYDPRRDMSDIVLTYGEPTP